MSLPMMPPESNGNNKRPSKTSESSQKGKDLEDHFIDSLSEEDELPDLFSSPSGDYDENSRTLNKAQRSAVPPIAGIPLENISIPEFVNSDSDLGEVDRDELPDFEETYSVSEAPIANNDNEPKATDDLDDEEELDRLLGLFDNFDESEDKPRSSPSEPHETSQIIESEPLLDSSVNPPKTNELATKNEEPSHDWLENLELDEDADSNDDQVKEATSLESVSFELEPEESTDEDFEEETIVIEDEDSSQSSNSSSVLVSPKAEELDESSILSLFELEEDDEENDDEDDEGLFGLSEVSKSILADSDDDEEEIVDLDFLDSIISSADDSDDLIDSDPDLSDSSNSDEEDSSQEYTLDSIGEDSDDLSSELNEYLNEDESDGIIKDEGESNSSDLDDEDFSSIFKEMGIDPNLLSDDDSSEDLEPRVSESYNKEEELEVDDELPDFDSDDRYSKDEDSDFDVDPSQFDSTEYDDKEEEDEDDDGNFTYEEEFIPPSNPFEVVPDNEQDEDDAGWGFEIEDDKSDSQDSNEEDKDESSENEENCDEDAEEDETSESEEDTGKDKKESILLGKLGGVFSSAALKLLLTNYLDAIKAEMKGKDAPPKAKLEDLEEEDEVLEDENDEDLEENNNSKGQKSKRKKKKKGKFLNIFGFLKPIKTLYLFVVNFFFKILTTILGILSKIPIIGRFISPLLSMTKLLQQLANYLPIVVLIGVLVLASFLSIPREHVIELPDSGGATFSSFKYDSNKEIAEGKITNTGEIIATVAPEFTVVTLQPELTKPKTWIVPQEVFKCSGDYTSVDIDSEAKVEVKCSSKKELPGYFPRVIGKISE